MTLLPDLKVLARLFGSTDWFQRLMFRRSGKRFYVTALIRFFKGNMKRLQDGYQIVIFLSAHIKVQTGYGKN